MSSIFQYKAGKINLFLAIRIIATLQIKKIIYNEEHIQYIQDQRVFEHVSMVEVCI